MYWKFFPISYLLIFIYITKLFSLDASGEIIISGGSLWRRATSNRRPSSSDPEIPKFPSPPIPDRPGLGTGSLRGPDWPQIGKSGIPYFTSLSWGGGPRTPPRRAATQRLDWAARYVGHRSIVEDLSDKQITRSNDTLEKVACLPVRNSRMAVTVLKSDTK